MYIEGHKYEALSDTLINNIKINSSKNANKKEINKIYINNKCEKINCI